MLHVSCQFSTVFTGPWRDGWRWRQLDKDRGVTCLRQWRGVSPFPRKPELSPHMDLSPCPPSPAMFFTSHWSNTLQLYSSHQKKMSIKSFLFREKSVWEHYMNMVFLISGMTLLQRHCYTSCAIAQNLKLDLKLSMTQQICEVTTVTSCCEPYLDLSVQCIITREITATRFSNRVALFFTPFLSWRRSKGVLSPSEWWGWCYPQHTYLHTCPVCR